MRADRRLLCLATFAALEIAAQPSTAQQAYELTDLGTLGGSTSNAAGINSAGQVVGSSTTTGDLTTHAFLYSQGTMIDLGTLGGTSSQASGINNSAQVVGSAALASGATHATLWNGTTPTDLGTQGTNSSSASAINNGGTSVGSVGSNAALFINGLVVLLPPVPSTYVGTSAAYAINDSGQIAGYNLNPGEVDSAVTWVNQVAYALSPAEGFSTIAAYGINNSGTIVGTGNNVATAQAFQWNTGASLQVTPQIISGPISAGYGINASGLVVGSSPQTGFLPDVATLWTSGGTVSLDLNTTLRPQVAAAYNLTQASAINDSGEIAATGTVTATGASHAFLLAAATSAGPPTATLTASESTVSPGQSFVLTWSSTNTWACVAGGTGPSGAPWSGILGTAGTQTIPAGTSTGQVTATVTCSFGNQSATTQAVVTVAYPPVTVTLSASPTTITAGQATTLTWNSVNATTCVASGGASNDGWSGSTQPTKGTKKITEVNARDSAVTLTFTLTCRSSTTNQSGSGSATVVDNPPGKSGGGAFDILTLLALALAGSRAWEKRLFRPGNSLQAVVCVQASEIWCYFV